MKVLVGEEVDKKLASFTHDPASSSTFSPNVVLDVDGMRETLERPATHTPPSYNATAPSYAPPHIPMPHINHIGTPSF